MGSIDLPGQRDLESQRGSAATALLEPVAVARLADLKLRARTIVEGALAGLHRSPHHGASVEFAEHKEYSPGDEIRHIDWKAYGKFDKYYVKRYEEETELRAHLVLDCSASMGYASERAPSVTKLTYASWLAAGIAYLLLRQQDQAGLCAFADGLRACVPPRSTSGHLANLLDSLTALRAGGATELGRAIDYVSGVARRRSLILVFSDLLETGVDDPLADDASCGGRSGAIRLLRGLRARGHDVALFHVLDGDELRLPFEEASLFEGVEDRRELYADPRAVRREYLAAISRFVDGCRRGCSEGDVSYQLVDTSRAPSLVLLEFLQGRSAQARGRIRR
jgi:uncharacterized protein (DUF58 family)